MESATRVNAPSLSPLDFSSPPPFFLVTILRQTTFFCQTHLSKVTLPKHLFCPTNHPNRLKSNRAPTPHTMNPCAKQALPHSHSRKEPPLRPARSFWWPQNEKQSASRGSHAPRLACRLRLGSRTRYLSFLRPLIFFFKKYTRKRDRERGEATNLSPVLTNSTINKTAITLNTNTVRALQCSSRNDRGLPLRSRSRPPPPPPPPIPHSHPHSIPLANTKCLLPVPSCLIRISNVSYTI